MNDAKYIGLDVHQATISVAILDSAGKVLFRSKYFKGFSNDSYLQNRTWPSWI